MLPGLCPSLCQAVAWHLAKQKSHCKAASPHFCQQKLLLLQGFAAGLMVPVSAGRELWWLGAEVLQGAEISKGAPSQTRLLRLSTGMCQHPGTLPAAPSNAQLLEGTGAVSGASGWCKNRRSSTGDICQSP